MGLHPQRAGKIRAASNTFQRVVDRLGLNDGVDDDRQKVVFHTLRHTFRSWLVMAWEDIRTVMELMGQSKIEQTMRYAHLAPDRKRQAIDNLDKLLVLPDPAAAGIAAQTGNNKEEIRDAK